MVVKFTYTPSLIDPLEAAVYFCTADIRVDSIAMNSAISRRDSFESAKLTTGENEP